ncbi:MAG: hypothetical protein C4555_04225 [Dehalococcoidia bacterium]|nr:MAG: hypothetical protein C4555_04225 [Dehalococcoidia bacterium]
MKILYVMRSISHFTYHESVVKSLYSDGHRVLVLFDNGWSKNYPDTPVQACLAANKNLTTGWSLRRKGLWRRPLFASRELLSYSSYLHRQDQDEFYTKRWQNYQHPYVKLAVQRSKLARKFIASRPVASALRTFERLVPPDTQIKRWLKENRPDVVVASPVDMRFSEEVEYVKAAKSLGIPTVVPVLSWDNLTTKGLFHAIPDITLAWNRAQAGEAASIHHVPADKIVITGSPFLDKWFDASLPTIPRDEFCRRVGLDPVRPFIVYLGSSANIARDETWLVEKLAASLRNATDKRLGEMTILARPHGANQEVYKKISAPNVKVWLRDNQLPDTPGSFAEFAASLRYAVCAAGLNTTAMVDAVIADCPVITLLVDEYRNTNASRAVHFQYILDAGVYEQAETVEQATSVIADLLDGKDAKRENRRKFILDFIRPYGLELSAGEVAARAIELAARGKSAAQINSEIGSRLPEREKVKSEQ